MKAAAPWATASASEVISVLLHRPPWHADALCKEHPDLPWFPTPRSSRSAVATAKAVCAACLVRGECLAAALADPDLVGIWGGTSARERRVLRAGKVA